MIPVCSATVLESLIRDNSDTNAICFVNVLVRKVNSQTTFACLADCFSSEDELDVLLNGTPDQKKKLIREYLTGESESSSGDEFEKEMEAELSSTMRTMEGTWRPPTAAGEVTFPNIFDFSSE